VKSFFAANPDIYEEALHSIRQQMGFEDAPKVAAAKSDS
jgi:uncharacterized protein YneF (UPF0154 family)